MTDLPRPVCPCGWKGAPCAPRNVHRNLAIHQRAKTCTYVPNPDPCTACGIEASTRDDGMCAGCREARTDPGYDAGKPRLVGGVWRWGK